VPTTVTVVASWSSFWTAFFSGPPRTDVLPPPFWLTKNNQFSYQLKWVTVVSVLSCAGPVSPWPLVGFSPKQDAGLNLVSFPCSGDRSFFFPPILQGFLHLRYFFFFCFGDVFALVFEWPLLPFFEPRVAPLTAWFSRGTWQCFLFSRTGPSPL